jgi:hypothetical protein
MGVLVELQAGGPSVLDRVTEPVQTPDTWVACPGEEHARNATRADQLIGDDVGHHPNNSEASGPPSDEGMRRSEWYEVAEALECDSVAVPDQCRRSIFDQTV